MEALLCAETGDKKPELKEEELSLDCPVSEEGGRGGSCALGCPES